MIAPDAALKVPSVSVAPVTVPEAVMFVAPVIAPDAALKVPSVSVDPVIVPPLKLPEPSLFTRVFAVLESVAALIISVKYLPPTSCMTADAPESTLSIYSLALAPLLLAS